MQRIVKKKEYVVWFNVAVHVSAPDQQAAQRMAAGIIEAKKDANITEANFDQAYPMPTGE